MAFEDWKASLVKGVKGLDNASPAKSAIAQAGGLDALANRRLAEIVANVTDLARSGEADGWPADDRRRWAESIDAIAGEWNVWEQLPAETRRFIEGLRTKREEKR